MTPVEELFQLLWDTPKDKLTWFAIKNQMLEKEKEAIISYTYDWASQRWFSVTRKEIEEDFNKTFNTKEK